MNKDFVKLMARLHSSCIEELQALSEFSDDEVLDLVLSHQKLGLIEISYPKTGMVISAEDKLYKVLNEITS